MTDDEELIRRVLDDNPGAQEEFVLRYEGLVLSLARRRFGFEPDAARELLQQVIERLWEHDCRALRAWRRNGRFSSYLTVIVCHICLRERRRAKTREEERPLEDSPPETFVVAEPSPNERLVRQERRSAVRDAYQGLSPRDRLVLALRFADERSPVEISSMLKMRPGTARKAIHDAVGRLKRRVRALQPDLWDGEVTPVPRAPVRAGQGDGG